jgi:PilZ domain-containing protein
MGVKRKSPRLLVMAKVEALWQDNAGNPRVAPATVEDRSRGGLSIRIHTLIKVGTKLIIMWQSEQFSGTVTHCRRDRAEYILGIQFGVTRLQP